MSILENIIAHKKREVAERSALFPVALLERSLFFHSPAVSLRHYLHRPGASGIIAEFKRRSPSKGIINAYASAAETSLAYMQAGASALSVLTDEFFFGGSENDLREARRSNFCPILRKDFILSEYQLIEARSIGADAVLLISEVLTKNEVKHLSAFAASLGLEVLLEMHSVSQLEKVSPDVHLVGVNNRDLNDFSINTNRSFEIAAAAGKEKVLVSESGLSDPATVISLREAGFQGFLIGEAFMRNADPGKACASFIASLKKLQAQNQTATVL